MKKDLDYLKRCKATHQKIIAITAYDYPMAKMVEEADLDVIILGDSVGTNVLGYKDETEVTLEDMLHHTKAVKRGITQTFLVVDLPFGTYTNAAQAKENALRLMDAGADAVKFEGMNLPILEALKKESLPVVCHIGLNPQHEQNLMKQGKITRGKTLEEARELLKGTLELSQAGADLMVVEKVPLFVSEIITQNCACPTIGIGSGMHCDGQVLIIYDLLGITERKFKHVPDYGQSIKQEMIHIMQRYQKETRQGIFPGLEHSNKINPEIFRQFVEWCEENQIII